jgi:cystine transport system substrate-binding protein
MHRSRLVLLIVLTCLVASGTWITPAAVTAPAPFAAKLVSRGELTIATTGSAAPWTMTTPAGGLQGYSVEMCNMIAEKLGVRVKWVTVDFAATLAGLTTGRFDMVCSSISQTPARRNSTDFSLTIPTVENGTTIMARVDDDSIKRVEDVKGKTIGAIANSVSLDNIKRALNDDVQVRIYPGYVEAVLDLRAYRVDAVPSDQIIASFYAKNDVFIKAINARLFPYVVGEAVRRENPELLAAVNEQLRRFLADGTIANLQRKWFGAVSLPPR